MTNTDRENLLLQPITDVSKSLGVPMSEIINVCASLGIQLLIEIPDDIAVFAEIKNNLFGHPIHSPPTASKVILSPGDPTTRKLLCVPASSAKLALKINKIQMHQFMHAAVFSEAKERFYNLTPKDFYRCENEAARNRAMQIEKYDCSLYNSPLAQREIPDSTIESSSFLAAGKAITIKPEDLIITKHDLNEIHKTINNKTKQAEKYPNYGEFRLGPWASPMLAHLNEASTLFVSSLPPEATKDTVFATLEEIKKWLTNEWGEIAGELLIDESSKAILPNTHSNPNYSEAIKHIRTIKLENMEALEQLIITDYASDALTAINIAAIYLHKLKDTQTINNDKALEILESKFGFKGRLIKAVSTIIRHNSRANKRLTK